MTKIFSKKELIDFNEKMLGRGMPIEEDGVGYNKADYGACAIYYQGLSDAQYADLAKRLVKYTETQLGVSKEEMKNTYKYYSSLATVNDRVKGVSVKVVDGDVMLSFRYNESFINVVRKLPKRRYDSINKSWIVPMEGAVNALLALEKVGADVKNAIDYVRNFKNIKIGVGSNG